MYAHVHVCDPTCTCMYVYIVSYEFSTIKFAIYMTVRWYVGDNVLSTTINFPQVLEAIFTWHARCHVIVLLLRKPYTVLQNWAPAFNCYVSGYV